MPDLAVIAIGVSGASTLISLGSMTVSVLSYRRTAPRPRVAVELPQKHKYPCLDDIDMVLWVGNKGAADLRVIKVKSLVTSHYDDECAERDWLASPVHEIEEFVVPKFDGVRTKVTVPLRQETLDAKYDDRHGLTYVNLLVTLSDGRTIATDKVCIHETWRDRLRNWVDTHTE